MITASSTFAALGAPNYRFYWIGLVFYVLGHRAEYVTIAWITWAMAMSALLQQKVPDHLRGRVMSIYSLCWNLLPLGGLLAGALAAAVDARFAVALGGAMVAVNALLLLGSRRLRAIRYDGAT